MADKKIDLHGLRELDALSKFIRDYISANLSRFEKVVEGDGFANPGVTIVYPKRLLPDPGARER